MNTAMTDQLLAYVLGHVDAREQAEVEAALERDAELRRQLELLRQAVSPLALDRDEPAAPDLAVRTIARVAEHLCQQLPHAPIPLTTPTPISRNWWSRADVLIAACLLIAVSGLGVFGIYRLRAPESPAAVTACQENLRKLYVGLEAYHRVHGCLPNVAAEAEPRNVAGMVAPILFDAGLVSDYRALRCPGAGNHDVCSLKLEQIRDLPPEEFANRVASLIPCYAYCLGFRDDVNGYHPPALVSDHLASQTPLLADGPGPNPLFGNSHNHGRVGQNILFADGHVRFLKDRAIAGDDIYLNRNREVAAGIDLTDFCLGASGARP